MKTRKIFLFVSLFLIIHAKQIFSQAGQLDQTFGQEGIVTNIINPIRQNSHTRAIVIQNDEKIVVAGPAGGDFLAMRYNSDGKLDNSFGLNGIASADGGYSEEARSLAMQSDGKLIAAGSSNKGGINNFALVRYNADGNKDYSFGNYGTVVTPIGVYAYSNSVKIQGDGKIVVAGSSQQNQGDFEFTLARYNSDGSLDSTFGVNGIVTTTIGNSDSYINSIKIQNDGKIVAAGKSTLGFTLVRYKVDGSLDNTFVVTTPFGVSDSEARSVAIQQDGKIVVAGDYSNGPNNNDFVMARFNSDGNLDSTFGTNGITITPIGEHNDDPNSVIIQNDGKLIAAGFTYNGTDGNFVLVRYNSNGSLDDSFGNNGIKITVLENSDERAYAVAKFGNGKIIATGSTYSDANGDNSITTRYNTDGSLDNTFGTNGIVVTEVNYSSEYTTSAALQKNNDKEKVVTLCNIFSSNNNDFALSRFNPDGSPDNTFGINGKIVTSINDSSSEDMGAIAIQNDGRIVVTGTTYFENGPHSVAVCFTSDGSLDNAFGMGGISQLPASSSIDHVYSIALQDDGKIIASGYSYSGNSAGFAALRFNADGSFDNTFGPEGIVIIPIGTSFSIASASAIQDDGKILLAGYYRDENKDNFALARCTLEGKLDSTFGVGGIVTTSIGSSTNRCYSIQLQNDGKIIAAGSYGNTNNSEIALVRYNSNGSLDSTFGTNGTVFTPTADSSSIAYSVKLQDDGKIVVGGSDGGAYLTLRYNNDGSLDSTFGLNGIKTDKYGAFYNIIKSIAIQKDGNIIAAGTSINQDETISVNTIIRYTGDKTTSITPDKTKQIPTSFSLLQNYPNPFNPSTIISWQLPASSYVTLKVYDILGREVATLVNEEKTAGNYKVPFDAKNLASGIYFYRLKAGNYISVKKMILLK